MGIKYDEFSRESRVLHVKRKVSYWTLIYRPTEQISFNVLRNVLYLSNNWPQCSEFVFPQCVVHAPTNISELCGLSILKLNSGHASVSATKWFVV